MGGGGEAFFCPRRLPSWENARGERWPYAGAPLTIRGDTSPAIIALPLLYRLIYGCIWIHTASGVFCMYFLMIPSLTYMAVGFLAMYGETL